MVNSATKIKHLPPSPSNPPTPSSPHSCDSHFRSELLLQKKNELTSIF